MQFGLLAVVLGHALLATWHGLAHLRVPVPLSTLQAGFVGLIVVVAPLVGAALGFTRLRVAGAALVCLSMGAALVFGLAYHFVVDSPDNIAVIPGGPWQDAFIHSAVGVMLSEVLGTLAGGVVWWRWTRPGAAQGRA